MQSLTRNNYYEILELELNSPQQDITTAYERAKATYSGDNPAMYTIFSEHEARELLVMIEEAYSVLGNKVLRMIYDQRLRSGRASLNELTYASVVEASKQSLPESKQDEKKIVYQKDEAFEAEIKTCDRWTGDFLKKVREYKQISVTRMHEITKVSPYYVNALEQTNAKNLPAPVFIRGYIVQIAKALGLEEKKVADSYMAIFKEQTKS